MAVPRESLGMISSEILEVKDDMDGTIKPIVARRRSMPHVAAVD